MQNPYWIAVIGLVGALIGALSSIITIYIQVRITGKREKSKLIFNTALEEHKKRIDHEMAIKSGASIPPLVTAILWYYKILKLLEKDKLNTKTIENLDKEYTPFEDYFYKKN